MVEQQKSNGPGEEQKKRKQRNLAIALMIAAFVIIVYAVTIMKLGAPLTERTF